MKRASGGTLHDTKVNPLNKPFVNPMPKPSAHGFESSDDSLTVTTLASDKWVLSSRKAFGGLRESQLSFRRLNVQVLRVVGIPLPALSNKKFCFLAGDARFLIVQSSSVALMDLETGIRLLSHQGL